MPIQPGDRLPEVTLKRIRDGVETVDTHQLFDGKKVVLFAVPGAFTPTCSERHLPGFVERFDDFHKRGIEVLCMSVNDPFVMKAWGESQHVPHGLQMLADGNGEFSRALGLDGCERLWHGHAIEALRAVRRGRRGEAAACRSAG